MKARNDKQQQDAARTTGEEARETDMGRRLFLSRATAAGGALAATGLLAACGDDDDKIVSNDNNGACGPAVTFDEETDIVVVGYGAGGAAAALKGIEKGAKVVILEKAAAGGGSTLLSGQAVFATGTEAQTAALAAQGKAPETLAQAIEYYEKVCDGNKEHLELIVNNSKTVYEWLLSLGMDVPGVYGMPGVTVEGLENDLGYAPHTHWPSNGLWAILKAAVEQAGADVRLSTPATALIQDPTSGAVIGVTARKPDGTSINIKAKKGVVLSAGGYGTNADMLKMYVTSKKVFFFGGAKDDGDGIKMGQAAGGFGAYYGLMAAPSYDPPKDTPLLLIAGDIGAENKPVPYIMVNAEASRFTSERTYFMYMVQSIMAQTDALGWLVVSGGGTTGVTEAEALASFTGGKNDVVSAATIAELAAAMQVDAAALQATVNAWDANCEANKDAQFGRVRDLHKLGGATRYYAAKVRSGMGSTFGGLWVDTGSRVLNSVTNEAIPRLYAAGVNTMALGRFYPAGGSANMMALVTGWFAGLNAANETAQS